MKKLTAFATLLLLTTACESMKDSLGMTHYQADEFNVKQHDTLELPPNYDLMPPRKKEKDKDGNSIPIKETAIKAKDSIGGDAESKLSEESSKDLADKAGSTDDSVRHKINNEAAEHSEESTFDSKVASWKKEFLENAASINSKKTKEALTAEK